MTSSLDRLLYAAITRRWSADKIASYTGAIQQLEQTPSSLVAAFQTIDSKASGLLTHVSMMIAGLGLIAPLVAKSRVEEIVVVAQIMIYLLIAMGCLRCLSSFKSQELTGSPSEIEQGIHRELILRNEIYIASNRFSIWFTVFVFVSIPLLWLWNP